MSTEQDGPHNIDAIRQLLQKIEKAADAEPTQPEPRRAPSRELSSLRPSPAVLLQPISRGDVVAAELHPDPSELEGQFEEPRRSGLIVALLFGAVLAAGATGAVIFQDRLLTLTQTNFPEIYAKIAGGNRGGPPSGQPIRPAGESGAKAGPTISVASQSAAGAQTLPASTIAMALDPSITVQAGESQAFALKLTPQPTESDALLLIVRGVPEEMALSQGSAIGNEIWLMPAHRAADLLVSTAENLDGTFPLTVELVSVDGRMIAQGKTDLAVKTSAGAQPAKPNPAVEDEGAKRLVQRGEKMLETGDVSGARLLFERAAETGSATAAFRLGETFDPVMLVTLGVRSISQGDEDMARRWYERAQALGHTGAAERLKDMRR